MPIVSLHFVPYLWGCGGIFSERHKAIEREVFFYISGHTLLLAFSALTLLVGRQEGHPACKKTGVVICLEQGADLHMAKLMPVTLTVSCFSKIQIGFAFLVPAHPGSPEKGVCVCAWTYNTNCIFVFSIFLPGCV